jgi:hypothetical protein
VQHDQAGAAIASQRASQFKGVRSEKSVGCRMV